jgi:hypothetical protein
MRNGVEGLLREDLIDLNKKLLGELTEATRELNLYHKLFGHIGGVSSVAEAVNCGVNTRASADTATDA